MKGEVDIMSVILKGYKYKILESYNNNGNSIEVTEADELETAIELDEFLECVKSYRDDDIEKLSHKRKKFGLIDEVVHELYEAFFDLVYYGSKEETWFLETFSLSENDLGMILA